MNKRIVLATTVAVTAIAASFLLIAALASAKEVARYPVAEPLSPNQLPPVTFPKGDWPWYAQGEITVDPEPPIAHHPTKLCAWVVNNDPVNPYTVTLEFSVANFGIGVPFTHVGMVDVIVPAGSHAIGCVVWTPPEPGHWCMQVVIHQGEEYPPAIDQFTISQRNVDIWEPLVPGEEHQMQFPVGPLPDGGRVSFVVGNLAGWDYALDPDALSLEPGEEGWVTLTTWVPQGVEMGSHEPLFDVEGILNGEQPIGGFRKYDWPPVPLHQPQDPPYAESEIYVQPYPPRAGEPTQICVELYNLQEVTRTVEVQFSWANFGIGLPFQPINGPITRDIPPHGRTRVCINWVPPLGGHFCVQAQLRTIDPYQKVQYEEQVSQRNIDVDEPLRPGEPHSLSFPVGNPFEHPVTITLGLIPHLPDWGLELSQDVLPDMGQDEIREVILTVTPPEGQPLPEDDTPIVDVEAYVEGELIGGFRKIFRSPVPVHQPGEPTYGESEISVDPYPPRANEPTKICARLRNYTGVTQTVEVQFDVANFGIGLPFMPIGPPMMVELPPYSEVEVCVNYVFTYGGHFCVQVRVQAEGYREVISQRNLDVDEVLKPGQPDCFEIPVGNPFDHPVTITLGLIGHIPGWEMSLSPNVLPNVQPTPPDPPRMVTLCVTPTGDVANLDNDTPVVDVEAYVGDRLIGGIRKNFRLPVPVHHPGEPPYGESEISVDPYPPRANEPTKICAKLRNYTGVTQTVEVQFDVANFGIGLPFMPIGPPMMVELPPYSEVEVCVNHVFSYGGHFCVQVRVQAEGYREVISQRNLDVDEVLEPGKPDCFEIPVGNPYDYPVTITLGLIGHIPGWEMSLSPDVLPNVQPTPPDPPRMVTLCVTPTGDVANLDNDTPVVDVEAYVDGRPIGGIRKNFRLPVPVHHPGEPTYGESEISVDPYPPRANEPTKICAKLRNYTGVTQTVEVQFDVANFGIGLPFVPIGPPMTVELPPYSEVEVCVNHVFSYGGHFCVQVRVWAEGYREVVSQRNLDVDEVLEPGKPDCFEIPVGNPYDYPVTITLGLIGHIPGWEMSLSPDVLPNVQPTPPDPPRMVTLCVTPTGDVANLDNDTPVVDVEAYVDGRPIGGIRKNFRLPVPVHHPGEPPYGESEISVDPYPPRANEPTKICAKLRNYTGVTQTVEVQFDVANFGIGLPFVPIGPPMTVELPPYSEVEVCVNHVFSYGGHFCVQVHVWAEGYREVISQRNLDVDEVLEPGKPDCFEIPVGNPYDYPVTITLGLIGHIPGWEMSLSPNVLPNVPPTPPGQPIPVTLCVTPTGDVANLDNDTPVVDVEAYVDGRPIGGIRKNFRLPVPVHHPGEPPYGESEISVDPYPPRANEPTKICAKLRNYTSVTQTVEVQFDVANFGIGLPFVPIGPPMTVELPPYSEKEVCVNYIFTYGGHFCVQVHVWAEGYREVISQRNLDVAEILKPGQPDCFEIPVGNPFDHPVTITLGLIGHIPGWEMSLSPDVLPNVQPGQIISVTLCVTPTGDVANLDDDTPLVDVEAYVDGRRIGGIRKNFRLPVPVHRPKDPVYAESEIGVDPYPVVPGQPVKLSVELHNPTPVSQMVTATFSIANFGIGLPFTTSHITPNPIHILIPANSAVLRHVWWAPPSWEGKFCVRVTLESEGYKTIWSQRNIDVGEPLRRGQPHSMTFPVGSWPHEGPVTVTLGLINHLPGWDVSLSSDSFFDVFYDIVVEDEPVDVTLVVTPPLDTPLGTGRPIVDVEAYVDGELIGGFRKLDVPPIDVHKPHEKVYAETELSVDPDPPKSGQDAQVCSVIQNTSSASATATLTFGWADFGMGIPFTITGMTPPTRTVALGANLTATACVTWTPTHAGHYCIQVKLTDPAGNYEPRFSQRNLDVEERPPCGETKTFTFTVYNDSGDTVTVNIGLITFNVPPDWKVTIVPSQTLTLCPGCEGVITVIVEIPCPSTLRAMQALQEMYVLQDGTGDVPIIDVEGYVDGELVGGIEIQFTGEGPGFAIYLPVILRNQ